MAKRRTKKRTHKQMTEEERAEIPRSLVIKMGDSKRAATNTLARLVRDFRQIMQPHTSVKLKERKANKLKDFLVMAGPLGVSHMFLFSISANHNTTLRVARTPRGPTLTFQVKNYSLCRDVAAAQKSPKSITAELVLEPPLLVMNGFKNQKSSDKEGLLTSMFQNMFPALNASTTSVKAIKRVLLLNKDNETGEIELRHYAIETKSVDISKQIKKLENVKKRLHKTVPDLSKKQDVADFLLDEYNGFTSESEVEDDAIVAIGGENQQQDSPEESKEQKEPPELHPTKKAIKLVELGPRLLLSLQKIEEEVCSGKVLYHSYIHKTAQEEKNMEKLHQEKKRIKTERRKVQEENVRRKKEAEANKSSRTRRGLLKQQEKNEETEKIEKKVRIKEDEKETVYENGNDVNDESSELFEAGDEEMNDTDENEE